METQQKTFEDVLIFPGAVVCGDVTIGKGSGVWFNAVIRGDEDRIVIGEDSNIQDGAVLHVDPGAGLHCGRRRSGDGENCHPGWLAGDGKPGQACAAAETGGN